MDTVDMVDTVGTVGTACTVHHVPRAQVAACIAYAKAVCASALQAASYSAACAAPSAECTEED